MSDQRRKLLQAHHACAVPVDLLRIEMDRLERERDQAERRLAVAATEFAESRPYLASRFAWRPIRPLIHPTAPPAVRRLIDRALPEKLYLGDVQGVSGRDS